MIFISQAPRPNNSPRLRKPLPQWGLFGRGSWVSLRRYGFGSPTPAWAPEPAPFFTVQWGSWSTVTIWKTTTVFLGNDVQMLGTHGLSCPRFRFLTKWPRNDGPFGHGRSRLTWRMHLKWRGQAVVEPMGHQNKVLNQLDHVIMSNFQLWQARLTLF